MRGVQNGLEAPAEQALVSRSLVSLSVRWAARDIPITAIVTMETVGTGIRYVFTALHRNEADFEKTKRRVGSRGPRSPSISLWRT